MRGLKIETGNYEYERQGKCPDWLERFADEYEKKEAKERTAVEVARDRNDLTEKINAIVSGLNGVAPYNSVDEAVRDYQKRTGLVDYQKQALAHEIITASEEEDKKKILTKTNFQK